MPKTFYPTTVGKILRTLREVKDISALRLAKKIDVSKEMIHAIENDRSNPSLHNLVSILDSYECDLFVVRRGEYTPVGKITKLLPEEIKTH